MELFNNVLHITGSELIGEIMPKGTFDSLAYRGRINVARRACYGTPALIEYASLPLKYRQLYESKFGDPRKRADVEPFLQCIKPDALALEFFTTYTYDDNKTLPDDKIPTYCNDAAILNALKIVLKRKSAGRRSIGMRTTGLWKSALALVDSIRDFYPCNLPKTDVTLKRKYDRYMSGGYITLVHAGYGNQNSSKVVDQLAEAFLLELLSHGNQLASPMVADTYNLWAEANGRPSITDGTVNNFRLRHEYEIMCARDGKKVWANKYDAIVKRARPSAPLLLINSDDNDLDLYFRAEYTIKKGGRLKSVKSDYYRFKMYVVLDAHCDYILGYALGDQITKEVIHAAYRNAMQHIKELTGSYYLWDQSVADHWGLKSEGLKSWFESISKFTPPTVGLARSKVIERSFGTEWHNELKRFSNYAGTNITAKNRANSEYIAQNIKHNPTTAEGEYQVAQFVARMRSLEWNKSGMNRQQVWLNSFKREASARERMISTETYLSLFGETHSHTNRITNGGVTITIDGNKYTYDVPDRIYRTAVGKKIQVRYEPENMGRVLVSDGAGLRFVATENRPMPMAFADMQDGDRQRLQDILSIKEQRRAGIKTATEQRKAILDRAGIDAHSMLQAGVLVKETRFKTTEVATRLSLGDNTLETEDIYTMM